MSERITGAKLNECWGVGAAHSLYIYDGHWYHVLKRFPGALFDRNGYIRFETETEFRDCRYLSIGKHVSVRKPGISQIPGYVHLGELASLPPEEVLPEEVRPDAVFVEGTVVQIYVNRYERDPLARAACIRHYGPRCSVCGFEFDKAYGPLLAGYINVHHLTPLASIGKCSCVDPVRHLRPICANCHAVVHRRRPPYSIDDVQQMIAGAGARQV